MRIMTLWSSPLRVNYFTGSGLSSAWCPAWRRSEGAVAWVRPTKTWPDSGEFPHPEGRSRFSTGFLQDGPSQDDRGHGEVDD